MKMSIAESIMAEYEELACEYDEVEANEWALEQIQKFAVSHAQMNGKDLYEFPDCSKVIFRGQQYKTLAA